MSRLGRARVLGVFSPGEVLTVDEISERLDGAYKYHTLRRIIWLMSEHGDLSCVGTESRPGRGRPAKVWSPASGREDELASSLREAPPFARLHTAEELWAAFLEEETLGPVDDPPTATEGMERPRARCRPVVPSRKRLMPRV